MVGIKNFGGKTHLLERGIHDLQVDPLADFLAGLKGGQNHLPHNGRVADLAAHFNETVDLLVHGSVRSRKMEFHLLVSS